MNNMIRETINVDGCEVPIYTLKGTGTGLTVAITAGIHGDELSGTLAVQGVMEKEFLKELRGTLMFIPMINPEGAKTGSRFWKGSDKDVNRLFPDNSMNATPLEHDLKSLFERISVADFILDVHCSKIQSVPFTYVEPESMYPSTKIHQQCTTLAEGLGLPWVYDSELNYKNRGMHRSLAAACILQAKKPSITLEIGPKAHVNVNTVKLGTGILVNALVVLGCLPDKYHVHLETQLTPFEQLRTHILDGETPSEGIVKVIVRPGDDVQEKAIIGWVYPSADMDPDPIVVKHSGVVLGIADDSWMQKNSCTIKLAVIKS